MQMHPHRKGLLICVAGVLVLSPDTLLIRLVNPLSDDDPVTNTTGSSNNSTRAAGTAAPPSDLTAIAPLSGNASAGSDGNASAGAGSETEGRSRNTTKEESGKNKKKVDDHDDRDVDTFTLLFWRFVAFVVGVWVCNGVIALSPSCRSTTKHASGHLLFRQQLTSTALVERAKQWYARLPRAYFVFTALNFCVTNIFFTLSVINTAVANTLVIFATAPMFGAAYSWLLLGEAPAVRTMVAMVVGVASIFLVFAGSLGGNGTLGDVFAAIGANSAGLNFVNLRMLNKRAPGLAIVTPVLTLSGTVVVLISLACGARPGNVSGLDWLWLWLQGSVVLAFAFTALSHGPKFMPAPEVSLVLLLETVTGPLWVWLALGEEPPQLTFVGGCLLLVTLAGHSYLTLKATALPADLQQPDEDGSEQQPAPAQQQLAGHGLDEDDGDDGGALVDDERNSRAAATTASAAPPDFGLIAFTSVV